jgi:hypothetical protein
LLFDEVLKARIGDSDISIKKSMNGAAENTESILSCLHLSF